MGQRPDHAFAIRGPLTAQSRLLISFVAPILVFVAWFLLTTPMFTKTTPPRADAPEGTAATVETVPMIPHDFLPSPVATLKGLLELYFDHHLLQSIWQSTLRILIAFGLSAAVALPLGILMGAFTPIQALLDPIMAPMRYMPITAFIPLLILWFGIYEQQKIAFLFLGTFVFLLPVVVTAIRAVPEELVQTALTLGANRFQVLRTVLIPHALPEIFDSFRVMNAIAWTYVILAEVLNAQVGIGFMIEQARTKSKPAWMFAGLIVVAVIGLATDYAIRSASRLLFRWREAT